MRELTIALSRGSDLHVLLVDEAGTPLSNAVVIEERPAPVLAVEPARHQWRADASGRVVIPMAPSTARDLWYVAPSGTFGRALINSQMTGTADAPHRITAPVPTGSIRVITRNQDAAILPNVLLALGYGGMPLPKFVMHLIAQHRAMNFRTGGDGMVTITSLPAGQYQWWGVVTRGENVGVNTSRPPVASMYFPGGQAEVTLTFETEP